MSKNQIKCYCGNRISDKDYNDVIDRLQEVGEKLQDGESANLSMKVYCSCGGNIVLSASVSKVNGVVRHSLTGCC